MSYSFANPLQVSLYFIADTVANTTPVGGMYGPLVPMDGSGYDYMTEALADMYGETGTGLPNDGFYASNSDHPNVQLAFRDTDDSGGPNSFILNEPNPNISTVTFSVPVTSYSMVQIYGTSTEGSSSMTVTLTYSDSTTDVTSFTVPDWFDSTSASAPVFVVQSGIERYSSSGPDYFNAGAALYGATASANPAKTLTSFTVTSADPTNNGRFVLYGATAY